MSYFQDTSFPVTCVISLVCHQLLPFTNESVALSRSQSASLSAPGSTQVPISHWRKSYLVIKNSH